MISPVKTRKSKTQRKRRSVSPRQRRAWLQKAKLCDAALQLGWPSARRRLNPLEWTSLCWALSDVAITNNRTERKVIRSILNDLAYDVDELGFWGCAFSHTLRHPSTSKGYHTRRNLLLLARLHYLALAEGRAPVLKLRPCYKHLA